MPKSVTLGMAVKTAMPSVRRISAPAPCANTKFERLQIGVAGAFEHELEPAGIAEAIDRRRPEDEDLGLIDLQEELAAQFVGDRFRVHFGRSALVERLKDDEDGAEVRANAVHDERLPRPVGTGGCPICPAATYTFCSRKTLITSDAVRLRDESLSGSSQTRML